MRPLQVFSLYLNIPLLYYCVDTHGLCKKIRINYFASEERLFIDSSKQSLKTAFLHNKNTYASISMAHSFQMQDYKNIKILLELIKY